MQKDQILKLLPGFLEKHGIETYKEGDKIKIKCLNPFHAEDNPSSHVNDNGKVFCYGCGSVYDIIDIVGWMNLSDDTTYLSAIRYLEDKYNFDADRTVLTKNEKPIFRGHVKKTDFVPLELCRARIEYAISVVMQRIVKAGVEKPTFEKAWPFLSEDGKVNCVDFRVVDSDKKKHVITAWFDGRYVRIASPPNLIWGLDHIDHSKPALIVEGAKCAAMAHEHIGDVFCVHTWNRGSYGAKYCDWSSIAGYSDFFLIADRDRKMDKYGNLAPKQIGLKTMESIGNVLLEHNEDAKIIIRESHECVETIKADGGDIVEMFDLMSKKQIVEYITKGN